MLVPFGRLPLVYTALCKSQRPFVQSVSRQYKPVRTGFRSTLYLHWSFRSYQETRFQLLRVMPPRFSGLALYLIVYTGSVVLGV